MLREKLEKLRAPDWVIKQSGAVRCDAVDLKNVLGQIEADCGSLHLDGSSYAQLWKLHYRALRRREQEPSTSSAFALVGEILTASTEMYSRRLFATFTTMHHADLNARSGTQKPSTLLVSLTICRGEELPISTQYTDVNCRLN